MADDVSLGEIHRILVEVRDEVRRTNGRVDKHDIDLAVLQSQMQSQHNEAKVAGRNWGAGVSALVSAIISGLIAGFGASK